MQQLFISMLHASPICPHPDGRTTTTKYEKWRTCALSAPPAVVAPVTGAQTWSSADAP